MDQANKFQQLLARAEQDPEFRQRLLSATRETLVAEGLVLPEGLEVRIHENTGREHHVVLPPLRQELSDADLDAAAGGYYDENGEWVPTFQW